MRAELVLQKLVLKAVLERNLIEDGDRILIAASGGKDSTMLARTLSGLRPALERLGRRYELTAVHIASDFCACCKKALLEKQLHEWGIPFFDLAVPIIGRLKEGRRMSCYWCSTQRRIELLRYAERGFNKIALGHHLDDILETFFMNLTGKGQCLAMPALLRYRKYPVTLIRPLVYVEESQIIAAAGECGVLQAVCTCPFGANSARKTVRKRVEALTDGSSAVKRRILKALFDEGLLEES